jgi:hypothetical protein
MRAWNNPAQYQMLFDALNCRNNSMLGLPREFINSCKAETVVTAHIANGLAISATDFPYKISQTFY